ncbi:MAG TPA: sialate O-acetylesterase [Pirellulales bacterium]|nr:sialate O-acetylesterase [Pirellulales bacterium]
MKWVFACLIVLLLSAGAARADVRVSNLFGDNMVLQREIAAPVWGMAAPGEAVTVKIGNVQVSVQADGEGKWMARLPTMEADAKPQDLIISGKNMLTIKNVLVGDVWICSGQSNMEFGLGGANAPQDVAAADYPTLRRIKFDHRAVGQPSDEVPGHWEVCTPGSAPGFTAVGFYFARRIQKDIGVPIGLLDDNWGGTQIEPWIPLAGFQMEPSLASVLSEMKQRKHDYREQLVRSLDGIQKWVSEARQALASPGAEIPASPPIPNNPLTDPGFPTTLYNGMIHPVAPFAIKGALWYQGESNGGEGDEYYHKMRALVGGWRKVWGQGDFPFYFVQLANFTQPNHDPAGGDGWARLRMAQFKSLAIGHSGMAVAIDLADADNPGDIHPKDKFDVGERLALWALAKDYGKKNLVYSGPLYKGMSVEDGKIRLHFDSLGSGLMVGKKVGRNPTVDDKDGKLKRFSIAGADKRWHWANAEIDGNTVVVSSSEVTKPAAVRYAYTMNPEGCNLYNREGLPASPFRTDEW